MNDMARVLTFLCLLAGVASAESVPAETLSLGWQTEHAGAVVLAEFDRVDQTSESTRREVVFVVRETIRGETKAGDALTLVVPDVGHGDPWVEGAKHLLFLQRLSGSADAPARWRPIPGATGIRPIPSDGVATRFPAMVAQIASTLAGSGTKVEKPAKLVSLLVGWLADADAGVVLSAALDLARHHEHLSLLTDAQRSSIVAAYRRHPVDRPGKGSLAMVVAMTGHRDAGAVLTDSLLLPNSRPIRGEVGDALVRLADTKVPARLVKALSDADAAHRATLVTVLGRVGGTTEVAAVRGRLRDEVTAVRIEAAHALGRMARRIRKKDPEARVDARVELYRRVLGGKNENELRACLWAMAQLDDATAWENLRRLSTDDARPFVRRVALRYLEKPRVSLELR